MPRYRPKIVWSPTLGDVQYQTNSYDAVKDLGRPLSTSPSHTTKSEQDRLARAIMKAAIVKAFALLFPRRSWRENAGPSAMGRSSALPLGAKPVACFTQTDIDARQASRS